MQKGLYTMTSTRHVRVTCPSCHAQGDFTVYKSINTKESPALKAKVRDGSLFQFVCPQCGMKTTVDYPFLYHQPEDHYMINYGKLEDGAKALEMLRGKGVALKDWATEMEKTTRPYVLRAVDDRLAFREKLFIFDAGLDDRLVEIYKFMVCYQYAAAGKAQGGEGIQIRRFKGQRTGTDQIEMSKGAVVAGRPGKGVLYGKAHIGQSHLGHDRSVAEFHEGVDQALGMDDDIDGLIGHIKQPVCFHDFQSFVGQGSAVYGYFGSHIPVGMMETLLPRYMMKLFPRIAPERAA